MVSAQAAIGDVVSPRERGRCDRRARRARNRGDRRVPGGGVPRRRAAEPLLPLRLFRNRVFVVTVRARQDCLRSLVADWEPDEDPRVNDAIVRLGAELAGEEPAADVHEQTTPAR
jgi:hypothetical protein